MVGRKRGDNPESLARGRERFEAWRCSRNVGARIPEKLWSLAVTLAEIHGLSRTASALKLDYHALKNRVAARNFDSSSVAPAFIELSPPPVAPSASECVIELEDGFGASLRVHLRGCQLPDLADLCRSFRRRD
ncbi:MAG: hypothetical protein KDB01_18390 [Planctomycetaceae bacterium]|nr:hypothetical protein [Planctomycetaceae bacterium]